MEILASRSTIALEDRQVIEQLIYTARELAATAARTAGFEHAIESNQRLALEMWEGAAYGCQASEQVTIKNIFLCNFLERLGEISRTPPATVSGAAPPQPTTEFKITPRASPIDPPSVVPDMRYDVSRGESGASYSDECVPECEREIGDEEMAHSAADSDPDPIELTTDQLAGSNDPEAAVSPLVPAVIVPEGPSPAQAISGSADEAGVPGVESIVISENEPYRFESCTVTVVMQLLPIEGGNRKCIVSVRTHDFAPHIEIASFSEILPARELAVTLSSTIEKYRNDLPVRAADKLKRQAVAGKKAVAKTVNSPKPEVQPASAIDARKTTYPTTTAVGGQQAGLFGG